MTERDWLSSTDPLAMLHFLCTHRAGGDLVVYQNQRVATERKLRLWACACLRHHWRLLNDERSRRAVIEMEAEADGEEVSYGFMARAGDVSHDWSVKSGQGENRLLREDRILWNAADAVTVLCDDMTTGCTQNTAETFLLSLERAEALENGKPALPEYSRRTPWAAALLRDLFGNPHRPLHFIPPEANLTTARAIAQVIYDERRFEDLPILCDALEEQGVQDESLLGHLRRPLVCPKCKGRGKVFVCDDNDAFAAGDVDCGECDSAGPHVRGCWALDLLLNKR